MDKVTIRILEFVLDVDDLNASRGKLLDLIKSALFSENKELFSLIDFHSEIAFSEPTLFYHFTNSHKEEIKSLSHQFLIGYFTDRGNLHPIRVQYDRFGLANFPNIGHWKGEILSCKTIQKLDEIEGEVVPVKSAEYSDIRYCMHGTDLLNLSTEIKLLESPELTFLRNESVVSKSIDFFHEHVASFFSVIKKVTRELVLFNSPNYNSFAAIAHHGTAYINTEGKTQTVPFFLDDIAHQCGHIVFNVLTLESDRFLRVPKESPLKKFSRSFGEQRTVYSAFHGLFTYTTILHTLKAFLDTVEAFDELARFEALGRIGFYLRKFEKDLKLMENPSILTDEGMFFHQQFKSGFKSVSETFATRIDGLKYYNQPYTFQFDRFLRLNTINKKRLC